MHYFYYPQVFQRMSSVFKARRGKNVIISFVKIKTNVLDVKKQVEQLHSQVNLRHIPKGHLYFVFNDLQGTWEESEKANKNF